MPAHRSLILVAVLIFFSCSPNKQDSTETIASVMDRVITRLYEEVPADKFNTIDDTFILQFLSSEEKHVLAERYQSFSVNVPVTVSIMRDVEQNDIPFWLEPSGFKKTKLLVKNEEYTYEVWQKNFDAGLVSLGVNGFDKHRPVYFVSVAPQKKEDKLILSDIYPSEYPLDTLQVGSFTYHDWSDLTITELPEELKGQLYFTTVRGRAREAHVVDAFRETPFKSSDVPDQVMQTWSGSPKTTIDIQWRTSTTVKDGAVRYWRKGSTDTLSVDGEKKVIQDRMLFNDRYVHRYTSKLTNLVPGETYHYQVGSKGKNVWTGIESFQTERADSKSFSFVWFGDTHCFPDSGKLVSRAAIENPDVAFYSIAGDLVSTGLYRDEWDRLFGHAGKVFAQKPLMPVPGNHDRQDGLGAQLYYDLFSLPQNGPEKVDKESSYFFEYGNALFIMIDATSDVDDHTAWIEKVLTDIKAKWKFVMFHFPPYNFEEPYPDIQKAWVPLFDRYHVDMVMGGHIHYYMRSQPMKNGEVVDSFDQGTVYTISISIPSKHNEMAEEPYAVKRYGEGYFYQRVSIEENTMRYQSVDSNGLIKDEFEIRKK